MPSPSSEVVELRQYTLRPGRHDELIRLFEREFIEPQEALGMRLYGLFCDARCPNRFVWLRGFGDMESRCKSLKRFYGGPVWRTHGDAANDTMLDSDNVLLLRPAQPGTGFDSAVTRVPGPLFCLVFSFVSNDESNTFARQFMGNPLAAHRSVLLAAYVSEPSANNYPKLPLREGEHNFVAFTSGRSSSDFAIFAARPSQIIDLVPTIRSRIQLLAGESPL